MPKLETQLSLLGPEQEASMYHDQTRTGFFSLLVSEPDNGRKRQTSHRLVDMPRVIGEADPRLDTWLSQAEFTRPNRRVVNLLRLGLLFADLDTYKMPWAAGKNPDHLASEVLRYCAHEGIPTPSVLVYSGRGIQAKWLLEQTIPRQALMRWNACQNQLISRMTHLGSDPAAKDASRVLRLIETTNSKSGEMCRVVHVETGLDGDPVRYPFEYMADVLLPFSRGDIERQRNERNARRQLRLIKGSKTGHLRILSGCQLAWHRLEDLRAVVAKRGGASEGERMIFLFWQLNFLLLSGATNSKDMHHEAVTLAKELDPHWHHRRSELGTLWTKAQAFEAGKNIEFNGKKYPALYTPRNDTLINMLRITTDEQQGLRTIISKDMAQQRHSARQKKRRQAAGAQDRKSYLKNAEEKQAQAQAFRREGLSVRSIAQRMSVSVGAISLYLNPKIF